MSKKKHYNNRGGNRGGGYAAKSNHTGAKLIAAIALLLAVAYVITSLALGMQWNPIKWFKKDGDVPTVPDVSYDDPDVAYGQYGYLLVSTSDSSPVALSSATRQVNGKATDVVTATVTPVDSDIFGVVWTSSNAESVAVTPIEGDNLSARLTCTKVFNEPITITCQVYSTRVLTATCRVDCLARLNSEYDIDFTVKENGEGAAVSQLGFGKTYKVCPDIISQIYDGTVWGNLRVTDWLLNLSDETLNALVGILGEYYDTTFDNVQNDTGTLYSTPLQCFAAGMFDAEVFRKAFAQVCYGKDDCGEIDATIEYYYGDKVYATFVIRRSFGFDPATYVKAADNVDITPDNPILGV